MRVLEQVDGTRTVADLVSGRQPLAVVRALANLAQQGAVTFGAAEIAPPPPAPLKVVPPPVPPPVVPPAAEDVAANVVDTTRPASRRFPVNIGLAVLALLIAVGLWVSIQRTQPTGGLTVSGEAPTPVARRADHATHHCAGVCPDCATDRRTDVSIHGRANIATRRCTDFSASRCTDHGTHDRADCPADFSASRCSDHGTCDRADCATNFSAGRCSDHGTCDRADCATNFSASRCPDHGGCDTTGRGHPGPAAGRDLRHRRAAGPTLPRPPPSGTPRAITWCHATPVSTSPLPRQPPRRHQRHVTALFRKLGGPEAAAMG